MPVPEVPPGTALVTADASSPKRATGVPGVRQGTDTAGHEVFMVVISAP
ncbi:hypothetical protein ACFYW1_03230 [Streptomyces sp. NPDC002669]